jgi:hypothetical protein
MLGYVLDGKVSDAIANVEANIRQRRKELCMAESEAFLTSKVLSNDTRVRETHHQRAHESSVFRIHHLFMIAR